MVNIKETIMDSAKMLRDAMVLGKKPAREAGENLASAIVNGNFRSTLKDGAGHIVDWAKEHPKQSIPTAIVAAGLMRTARVARNSAIGNYSATISRGQQSAPSGSAAGMNNEASAWIQPNGAGYDNASYQGNRYNFAMQNRTNPLMPQLSTPGLKNNVSSVSDDRYDTDDMNKDQLYSRMV